MIDVKSAHPLPSHAHVRMCCDAVWIECHRKQSRVVQQHMGSSRRIGGSMRVHHLLGIEGKRVAATKPPAHQVCQSITRAPAVHEWLPERHFAYVISWVNQLDPWVNQLISR